MARADLLIRLMKSGSNVDQIAFQKAAEDLIAEENRKGHRVLAERMRKALRPSYNSNRPVNPAVSNDRPDGNPQVLKPRSELFYEITPERRLESLFLPPGVKDQILDVVEEQHRSDLLHSYNLKARHRLLFAGAPGNGKTTLAETLAFELMYPLIVIRYESLIGSYLGETSSRIKNILEYARTLRCVLFFDEFETLGKERGDTRETGEIKRIVSSLLLQTDALPDYVVLVAASNHPELLDRAVWRRFQVKVELPSPSRKQLTIFIDSVAKRCEINFGYATETLAKALQGSSYAEAEQFCLDIVRHAILSHQNKDAREITERRLLQWKKRLQPTSDMDLSNGG